VIIVSDTSPLNYLIVIQEVEMLPVLYQRVLIPETVFMELKHPHAPAIVRNWMLQPPPWLETHRAGKTVAQDLEVLDPAERDALSLAIVLGADLAVIDDAEGRRAAQRHNVRVIGTLGVLDQAAERGLVDLSLALSRLQQTSFRVSKHVIEDMLEKDTQRKIEL
jgi:predicted nucleic acid-binding protein